VYLIFFFGCVVLLQAVGYCLANMHHVLILTL
jgi:hypothetical protein